jgi:hypothetical protein
VWQGTPSAKAELRNVEVGASVSRCKNETPCCMASSAFLLLQHTIVDKGSFLHTTNITWGSTRPHEHRDSSREWVWCAASSHPTQDIYTTQPVKSWQGLRGMTMTIRTLACLYPAWVRACREYQEVNASQGPGRAMRQVSVLRDVEGDRCVCALLQRGQRQATRAD